MSGHCQIYLWLKWGNNVPTFDNTRNNVKLQHLLSIMKQLPDCNVYNFRLSRLLSVAIIKATLNRALIVKKFIQCRLSCKKKSQTFQRIKIRQSPPYQSTPMLNFYFPILAWEEFLSVNVHYGFLSVAWLPRSPVAKRAYTKKKKKINSRILQKEKSCRVISTAREIFFESDLDARMYNRSARWE